MTTITVKELINALNKYPADKTVVVSVTTLGNKQPLTEIHILIKEVV